jgi:LmbE family N-acetylglucosaminyl deacetylase/O-antigen/teichoic acid export membrane protein
MVATVVVGIGNYGFSLAVVWLLTPTDFSEVSSLSSLLLVVGSASNAALPWVLARGIGRTAPGSAERHQTIGFTILASIVCGGSAALVVVALSARYASAGAQTAAAITALSIFVAGVLIGYLQGLGRFVALAVIMTLEVVVKLALGVALAATSLRAVGALTGAAIATGSLALCGLLMVRREARRPPRGLIRTASAAAMRIGSVQLAVSLLVTMDIIAGSIRHGRSSSLAGYQAMVMFTRLPFFASIAVSMVIYPRLSAAADRSRQFNRTVGQIITIYFAVASASVAIVATLPEWVTRSILPARYGSSAHLLGPLAAAGMAAGLINLTTTFFQAAGRFRAPLKVLVVACLVGAVVLGIASSSVERLAWAAAATFGLVALVLLACVTQAFPGARTVRRCLGGLVLTAGYWVGLRVARDHLPIWVAASCAVAAVGVLRTRLVDRDATLEGMRRVHPAADRRTVQRARRRARRRRWMRWLSDRSAKAIRPLESPDDWSGFVAARSLAGSGPAIVIPKASRVLVIAPHPDDETIGCGGTIAQLASTGSEVRVVVATDGEASLEGAHGAREVSRRRRLRQTAACERLGVGAPTFLGLPDAGLEGCTAMLVSLLAEQLEGFEPDIVFVPWPLDGHPDHRAVATSLARLALPSTSEIWNYEVWTSLPPNRLVDISDWWEDKTNALDCHRLSEHNGGAHLALQRWRSLHGLSGRGYAEAFLALTPVSHRRLIDELAR